MKYKINQPLDS